MKVTIFKYNSIKSSGNVFATDYGYVTDQVFYISGGRGIYLGPLRFFEQDSRHIDTLWAEEMELPRHFNWLIGLDNGGCIDVLARGIFNLFEEQKHGS